MKHIFHHCDQITDKKQPKKGGRLLLAQSVGTTHHRYLLFEGRNSHSCGTNLHLTYILEDQTHTEGNADPQLALPFYSV